MRTQRPTLAAMVLFSAVSTVFACAHASPPATESPAAGPQATAGAGGRAEGRGGVGDAGEGRGGRGGPGNRVKRPPNYEIQDSIRRATVAEVLRSIAGREHEPAGRVFKNVKLLKNVPADEFLKTMDETYGRSLAYTCSNCHVETDFASDKKKGKVIGRQMQAMTIGINRQFLSHIKEMDDDYQKATCVSCHKSGEKVNNKMVQPTNAPG